LGSVFTNTRKGTSARAIVGDHAIATPSATPAAPARTKPPRISSVVTQRCVYHGIEKFSAAFPCSSPAIAGALKLTSPFFCVAVVAVFVADAFSMTCMVRMSPTFLAFTSRYRKRSGALAENSDGAWVAGAGF